MILDPLMAAAAAVRHARRVRALQDGPAPDDSLGHAVAAAFATCGMTLPLFPAQTPGELARELVRMRLQLTARIEALTDQAERAPLDDQPLF